MYHTSDILRLDESHFGHGGTPSPLALLSQTDGVFMSFGHEIFVRGFGIVNGNIEVSTEAIFDMS